jgi:DNA-binding HxlR family transcriptional regulator
MAKYQLCKRLPLRLRVTFKKQILNIRSLDMENNLKNFSDIENCPIRNVVSRFGSKWTMLILLVLNELPIVRFSELAHALPDISSKVLTKELKILEADGLISRQAYATIPPRVEYQLTERSKSLMPILLTLTEWARENMASIREHRQMCQ